VTALQAIGIGTVTGLTPIAFALGMIYKMLSPPTFFLEANRWLLVPAGCNIAFGIFGAFRARSQHKTSGAVWFAALISSLLGSVVLTVVIFLLFLLVLIAFGDG
jgi:hypothetical protein